MLFLRRPTGWGKSPRSLAVFRPYVNNLLYFEPVPPGALEGAPGHPQREKSLLEQRLEEDMKSALKAGDQARLSTIRMVRSQILLEKKKHASGTTLTDDQVLTVVGAYGKKLRESAAEYEKLGRAAEAAKIREELAVVQSYLPQQLTEPEARELAKQTLTELGITSVKDFGRAMKEVQSRVKGRADGKLISEIVRSMLD